MKVRHFVITRFLCNSKMNLGDRVFDKDMIENGVRLLTTYLLPSLKAQSNMNFEWIILVHKNTSREYLKPLYEIDAPFPIRIVDVIDDDFAPMHDIVKDAADSCDWLITSRIDYDDMIYTNAVRDIQDSVIRQNRPMYIYTWKNVTWHDTSTETYEDRINPFAKNGGGMSVMVTLVQNMKKCKKAYDIYMMGNHTRLCTSMIENGIVPASTRIEEIFVQNEKAVHPLMYTMHSCNDCGSGKRKLNARKAYAKFGYDEFFGRKKSGR